MDLGLKLFCVSFYFRFTTPPPAQRQKKIPPGIPDKTEVWTFKQNQLFSAPFLKILSSDGPGQTVTSQYLGLCQKLQGGL